MLLAPAAVRAPIAPTMKYCTSLFESPLLLAYLPKSGTWLPLDEPLNGLWYEVHGAAAPPSAGRTDVVLSAAARTAGALVAVRRHAREACARDAIVCGFEVVRGVLRSVVGGCGCDSRL